jgi:histone-lysine N-methyltransferase SETMAR
MAEAVEYRSVIKFLLLRNVTKPEILQQLQEAYQDNCPSRATIYNWIREFRSGRQSVFDTEREGRPSEISDEKNILCEKIIKEKRRISIRDLSVHLNVSLGSCHAILHGLGIRKLCSRFVPKFLSGELCDARLESCTANLQLLDEYGPSFLNNIVTEDETPICLYVPDSRRDSAQWCLQHETAPRKLRAGTSHNREAMLTVFWQRKGIIQVDFLGKGKTMNGAYYTNLLREARKSRRKAPRLPIWFLHDNAPIHTCNAAKATLDDCGFQVLLHPPYSPDLAPSDFALFKVLKKDLKGRHFESAAILKKAVEDFLAKLPKIFFEKAFDDLVHRWKKCVEQNGSYIEK